MRPNECVQMTRGETSLASARDRPPAKNPHPRGNQRTLGITYRAFFLCAISMLGAVGGNPARERLRQQCRRALVGMTEARGVEPRQGLRS